MRSPTGIIAEVVCDMCWWIIRAWWSRHRIRWSARSSSESESGSTAWISRCSRIAAGFVSSSHSRRWARHAFDASASPARPNRSGISSSGAGSFVM